MDKQVNNCHKQLTNFSPLILSVGGILGKEALVVLADLSRLMEAKVDEPISHVRGWVNGRIAIAVARSYSCMILGSNLTSTPREK